MCVGGIQFIESWPLPNFEAQLIMVPVTHIPNYVPVAALHHGLNLHRMPVPAQGQHSSDVFSLGLDNRRLRAMFPPVLK